MTELTPKQQYHRAYYLAHREKLDARHAAWNAAHKEQKRAYGRRYVAANKTKERARTAAWRAKNKQHCAERDRKYNAANKVKIAGYLSTYRAANKPMARAAQRRFYYQTKMDGRAEKFKEAKRPWRAAYMRNRRQVDTQFRLAGLLRGRLASALKTKAKRGSAVTLLGCSIPEALAHIERLFQPGMTWDNQGLWHIDHKRPLASFDLEDAEQLTKACHYSNLQPLWARDNLTKWCHIGGER